MEKCVLSLRGEKLIQNQATENFLLQDPFRHIGKEQHSIVSVMCPGLIPFNFDIIPSI